MFSALLIHVNFSPHRTNQGNMTLFICMRGVFFCSLSFCLLRTLAPHSLNGAGVAEVVSSKASLIAQLFLNPERKRRSNAEQEGECERR